MTEYKVNLLSLTPSKQKTTVHFSHYEKAGYQRIFNKVIPEAVPKDFLAKIEKFAWWSLSGDEEDLDVEVSLDLEPSFSKRLYSKLIYDHFLDSGLVVNKNFLGDTQVYLESPSEVSKEFKVFDQFSIRVDKNHLVPELSLLVSYEGSTRILNKSLEETGLPDASLGKVLFRSGISRFSDLDDGKRSEIYPVRNREIDRILNIPYTRNYSENKYKKYYEKILDFYIRYLKDLEIENWFRVTGSGFAEVYDDSVFSTSADSNLLVFGDEGRNFSPYVGMKENGPLRGVDKESSIKFIFIFHEDDKEYANRLFAFFKKGYKNFPGLDSFATIDFEIDESKTIRFTEKNPVPEIRSRVEKYDIDPDSTFAAIYISRIKKDSDNDEEIGYYYQIKELLLKRGITSQVIYKGNIDNPAFNFFLPNIAIALLAKLGGIPWRLHRPLKKDLVVGVGVARAGEGANYRGNAFCFRNDGMFRGFNVFEENDTQSLASSIKTAITEYLAENDGIDRLVIHYYKEMNKHEEGPIAEMLNELNPDVPYVVITVTETWSKDYVLFDNAYDGKMPTSGTFVKVKYNQFILCNNTRYSSNTPARIDGFPLPIKIRLKSPQSRMLRDMNTVTELIDQVYQFSRMYWKSVRQRSMPVTIEYSQLIAEMVRHFESKDLVPFARNSLWFL